MAIWKLLEPLFVLLVLIFILTQVVLPPVLGKPLFWIFRKSEKRKRKSEAEMDNLKTNLEAKKVDEKIQKLKEQL
mgnify:FL=1